MRIDHAELEAISDLALDGSGLVDVRATSSSDRWVWGIDGYGRSVFRPDDAQCVARWWPLAAIGGTAVDVVVHSNKDPIRGAEGWRILFAGDDQTAITLVPDRDTVGDDPRPGLFCRALHAAIAAQH